MKVKWVLETGFNGCVQEGEIEVDDDASNDEIEKAAKEKAFFNISLMWKKLKGVSIIEWYLKLRFTPFSFSGTIDLTDKNLTNKEIWKMVEDDAYSVIDLKWSWRIEEEESLTEEPQAEEPKVDTADDNSQPYIGSFTLQQYIYKNMHHPGGFSKEVEDILSFVVMHPASNVKPIRCGQWHQIGGFDSYSCSECSKEVDGDDLTPYCPNCGAKMSNGGVIEY